MSDHSETVVGNIHVVARLALGIEHLVLFVTDARIIVAHLGKRGAGSLATSALFGRLSGGFEDLVKSGTESRGKRALPLLTPQRILSANKHNFPMEYGEIVSVRVAELSLNTQMTVLTKDNKFDFQTAHPLESIVELLQVRLGSKLSVERLPPGRRPNRQR